MALSLILVHIVVLLLILQVLADVNIVAALFILANITGFSLICRQLNQASKMITVV